MSDKHVCPSCGGHKPPLMACRDCGFKFAMPEKPPQPPVIAPSPKPSAPAATSFKREARYVAGSYDDSPKKSNVVIKTKKRRVYEIPDQ